MKISTRALAAWLAAMALPVTANAATYLITYTGTVTSGFDYDGLFGAANTSLTGQAFTTVYTLTAPLPGAAEGIGSGYSITAGGTLYGVPSPLSGEITINSFSQLVGGNYQGEAAQYDEMGSPPGYDKISHYALDKTINGLMIDNGNIYNYIKSHVNNIVNSSNYTDHLNYSAQEYDDSYGNFSFYTQVYDPDINQYTPHQRASGNLRATSVTIAMVTPVTEPATWAMMIAGFGFIGGAMRQRRKTTVSYA